MKTKDLFSKTGRNPPSGVAVRLAESLVRKLKTGHYLVDEANHLNIETMKLLRYIYDQARVGVVLVGTLRLYEVFTDGSRPASELEQLWSRFGSREVLPRLTEYEAQQIIQTSLGRISEQTVREILRLAGNPIRRLTKLLDRLNELQAINAERSTEELIRVAGGKILVVAR